MTTPNTSPLYSGEIPASEVIAQLKHSAEVSAALIAEIRALVSDSHARHYTGTGAINEPYTVECSAWEGIMAALAKTPESVGADLDKVRTILDNQDIEFTTILEGVTELARIRDFWENSDKGQFRVHMLEALDGAAKLEQELAQKDARIVELEHDRNISDASAQLMADDVKEAQCRMEKAEAQRDDLIPLCADILSVIEERSVAHVVTYSDRLLPFIPRLQAAVKQSGNQSEVSASSTEGAK